MSAQHIIESLVKLVTAHQTMLDFSKEKTELLKEGAVEKLQAFLLKERKQIRILEKAENNRQEITKKWFEECGVSLEDITITKLLEVVENEEERGKLAQVATTLTNLITQLKQQEELNQLLLKQSAQFVQMSMALMNPQLSNMNYGNPKKGQRQMNRSLFDSEV